MSYIRGIYNYCGLCRSTTAHRAYILLYDDIPAASVIIQILLSNYRIARTYLYIRYCHTICTRRRMTQWSRRKRARNPRRPRIRRTHNNDNNNNNTRPAYAR